MKCPDCGSNNIRRSHRVGLESTLGRVFFFNPYRCRNCGKRFRSFGLPLSGWKTKLLVGVILLLIFFLLLMPQLFKNSKTEIEGTTSISVPQESSSLVGKSSPGEKSRLSENPDQNEPQKVIMQITRPLETQEDTETDKSRPKASAPETSEKQADLNMNNKKEDLTDYYYCLHIGSFKRFENVKAILVTLTKRGFDVWWEKVEIPQKGEWFRVFTGKRKSKEEALELGEKLKSKGIIDEFSITKKMNEE